MENGGTSGISSWVSNVTMMDLLNGTHDPHTQIETGKGEAKGGIIQIPSNQ